MPIDLPAGPTWVTLAYFAVYYATQVNLMRVKARLSSEYAARDEKFDRYFGQDRELLAADRIQLNMLEHMPVFLVLLWLAAYAVGPGEATIAGAIYVASRVAYPLFMGKRLGRGIPMRILFATGAGYGVIGWLMVRIAMSVL